MKTLQFSTGGEMPVLGLGTWKSATNEVYEAVKTALAIGYRHIDCAAIYGNEKEVGEAVKESIDKGIVTREDLWITSKLWNNCHGRDQVIPALKKTLEDLQLDYLDLYLIHWPVPLKPESMFPESGEDFLSLDSQPISDTWKGMEAAHKEGLAKQIGVSNFGIEKLTSLFSTAIVKPMVNQVELHPYLAQNPLVDFCKDHEIFLTAYSPLGSNDRPERLKASNEPILLKDETIQRIAVEKGISAAQVLLSWQIHRGISVIPKSVNSDRLAENLAAAEISLSSIEMNKINSLDLDRRYIDGSLWTLPGSPHSMDTFWK
ncbi:MAG: aldo/keto reductase [Bacteroidota bacterium]